MASSQRPCSSRRGRRTDARRGFLPGSIAALALLVAGCGHADEQASTAGATNGASASVSAGSGLAAPATATAMDSAAALCVPSDTGLLRARLQGAIDAEIDWGSDSTHCRGGVRPQGDGVRLLYKGTLPGAGPVLIVLGATPLRPGESARNVPVNLTLVREGTGEFYATQGNDKCALDSVTQVPLDGAAGLYRLEGRGYCTQPARAVGGEDSLLLSRFDVVALVPSAP
jgi:hypothetical protein